MDGLCYYGNKQIKWKIKIITIWIGSNWNKNRTIKCTVSVFFLHLFVQFHYNKTFISNEKTETDTHTQTRAHTSNENCKQWPAKEEKEEEEESAAVASKKAVTMSTKPKHHNKSSINFETKANKCNNNK